MDIGQIVKLLPYKRITEAEALALLHVDGTRRWDAALFDGALCAAAAYGLIKRHSVTGTTMFGADVERLHVAPAPTGPVKSATTFVPLCPAPVASTISDELPAPVEYSPGVTFHPMAAPTPRLEPVPPPEPIEHSRGVLFQHTP